MPEHMIIRAQLLARHLARGPVTVLHMQLGRFLPGIKHATSPLRPLVAGPKRVVLGQGTPRVAAIFCVNSQPREGLCFGISISVSCAGMVPNFVQSRGVVGIDLQCSASGCGMCLCSGLFLAYMWCEEGCDSSEACVRAEEL